MAETMSSLVPAGAPSPAEAPPMRSAAEVVASISVEDRFSNRFDNIHEVIPDLEGAELQEAFDMMFLIAGGVTLTFMSGTEWLHERCPFNDRGDAGTIQERKESWESHGLYRDIRSGAWVRPQWPTIHLTPQTKYYWLHFASLMQGGKAAYGDPKNASNVNVHNSIKRGLEQCKVYRNEMPPWACKCLVGLGNAVNSEVEQVTHLQMYRVTEGCQASWLRNKTITVEKAGQGRYEAEKLAYINKCSKHKFKVISHFEKACTFFRESKKYMVDESVSVWDAYVQGCQESVLG